jgi:hypothetical protein
LPNVYSDIKLNYKGNIDKYLDKLFKKSFVTNEKRLNKYLDDPKEEVFNKDMLIVLAKDILKHKTLVYNYFHSFDEDMNRAFKLYSEGCLVLNSDYYHAPEADYSLRMGYGFVSSYRNNPSFTVSAISYLQDINIHSILSSCALDSLTFTNYVSEDSVRTSFLTTCDAPLLRMGEPVFNLKGEIVGMLTSGTSETEMNNYMYHESFRTIATDINYLMYLLDVEEADNIIGEIVLGEEEEIVEIEYFTPVDSLLIPNDSLMIPVDSLLINADSLMINADSLMINADSIRVDSLIVAGTSTGSVTAEK